MSHYNFTAHICSHVCHPSLTKTSLYNVQLVTESQGNFNRVRNHLHDGNIYDVYNSISVVLFHVSEILFGVLKIKNGYPDFRFHNKSLVFM